MSKILGLFEISQVLVVCDHHHWMFGPSEVMSPFLQSLDDGEKFSVIDVIVSLHRGKGGRMVGTGVEVSIGVLLHQYSP